MSKRMPITNDFQVMAVKRFDCIDPRSINKTTQNVNYYNNMNFLVQTEACQVSIC